MIVKSTECGCGAKCWEDAHVDRAEAAKITFNAPSQTLVTEGPCEMVWASHGISSRVRSILTLALPAVAGNFEEIALHIRGTARTAINKADMMEAVQHVAIYVGVPCVNHAPKLVPSKLSGDGQ